MTHAPLAGRTAVVTGGSNGIGAACVRALAAAGARVAICYHSGAERAEALRGMLPGTGHRTLPLDLTDPASVRHMAEAVRAAHGHLDILVNSAGVTRPIPHADLDTLDEALFDQILIANARGPYSVIRALLPLLRAAGGAAGGAAGEAAGGAAGGAGGGGATPAVVVNITSVAALNGAGSNIAYGAAKAALETMTMSLARVLGPEVRLMCVAPGPVATDFVAGRGRDALEKLAAATPLRRVVEAEDVAQAVMACITHLPTSTGSRIVVDGGRML